jgi:hypothetical protein
MRKRIIGVTLGLSAASLAGCHDPGGAFLLNSTGASQTYYSTEVAPRTVRLIDTRTDEVLFEMEVPPGKQLTIDFEADEGDDPVLTPDLMRWQVFDLGTSYGKLRNAMTVPNSSCRRLDWEIRSGVEYQDMPPEYQLRSDQAANRPAWWTSRGGPLPERDAKTTMYDN